MTLDDARNFVALTGVARKDESCGHAALVDWYRETADEAARDRALQAAEALLNEGNDSEQSFAVDFLGCVAAPPELQSRLAQLYASRGWGSEHRLARFLSYCTDLTPEAQATLHRAYISDPGRQVALLRSVLPLDSDGRAWEAYLHHVRSLQRPHALVEAYESCPYPLRSQFFPALRDKNEDVVRRTARGLVETSALELLSVCGYAFDPREPERRSPDPIPVEEMLELLESQRCSLWWMLPAPVQYPEDRDRSVFYSEPSTRFPRSLLPWARRRTGQGHFCDAWYRRDPPEVVSMECWTPEEFRTRFRRQWGTAKLVPLAHVEPFARVPPFVLAGACRPASGRSAARRIRR